MAAVATSRSGLAAVHPASSRRPPRWDPLSWVAAPLAGRECVSVSVSVLGVCGRRSPEPRDSSAPEQWSPAGRAWPGATSPVAGVARAGRGSWKGSELATASRAAGGEADASRGSGFPGGPGYRWEK